MKDYERYLFDDIEKLLYETHKNLAIDGLYKPEINTEEAKRYSEQCLVVESAYVACCNLMQIDNIEMCTGGGYFHFDIVHSVIDNIQSCSSSPLLSREKLFNLKIFEVSNIICSIFLDRENWSKQILNSIILSDGNGNWI